MSQRYDPPKSSKEERNKGSYSREQSRDRRKEAVFLVQL
jgi:stalled ribosome alternative rescue factor ArfA